MPKKTLQQAVSEAAQAFALEVVEAVKGASIQELIALQGAPKPRGRKPGTKRGPGRPPKTAQAKKTRKKRTNYPKCAYPKCNRNRFPRGKGFCGEHYKQWKAGKIKSAEEYKKPTAKKK